MFGESYQKYIYGGCVRRSEQPDLFVDFREPTAFLRFSERTLGVELDAGIRDVRGNDAVVSSDVVVADNAAQHDVLRLAGECHDAHALDHEITVRQHVRDLHGGAGIQALRVADVTTT